MANARALTSTSYAILGLLSLRPWTTYELAQQMQRALGQFWPRAESKLYEEPKKLVDHGLATATAELVGRRPRTVYAITPAGRKALKAWMPQPSAGPVVEFEGLVRVFYAEHGTKDDLLAAIDSAHAWVERRYEESEGISRGYLDGRGRLPGAPSVAHPVRSVPAGDDRARSSDGRSGPPRRSRGGPRTSRQPSPTSRPSTRWPRSPRPTSLGHAARISRLDRLVKQSGTVVAWGTRGLSPSTSTCSSSAQASPGSAARCTCSSSDRAPASCCSMRSTATGARGGRTATRACAPTATSSPSATASSRGSARRSPAPRRSSSTSVR